MWFRRWRIYREFVQSEAFALLQTHGDEQAYRVARSLMRLARAKGDRKTPKHFSRVALEIARLTNREIGLDTATRYLRNYHHY
jgi:hypothetical protein